MRMMVLASSYPAYKGDNAGKFVEDLARSIIEAEEDVSISIVTPHRPGAKKSEERNGININRFKYTIGEKAEYLSKDAFADYLEKNFAAKLEIPLFFKMEFLCSLRTVKKSRIDIIHSHWLVPQGLIGAVLRRLTGLPHLLTLHAGGVLLIKKYPFKERIATFVGRNSDVILPVSRYIRDEYLSMVSRKWREDVKKKCVVVPMGTDTNKYQPLETAKINLIKEKLEIPPQKLSIGYLGRLSEKKGVEYLIEALNLLKNKNPALFEKVILSIGGSGPLKNELQRMVTQNELEEHVKFHGFVPDKDLNDFINAMDIFVLTSIVTESGDTEGLPVVLMEAMAAGKAIIGTNVSGMGETIIHNVNGMVVEQRKPSDISNTLILLVNDIEKRELLGKNAREYAVENFSWDVIRNRYLSIARDLQKYSFRATKPQKDRRG